MIGSVLVVDDDPGMCELLAAGLTHRDFQVRCRTSGAAGLALAAEEAFDAVLTDLNMSGMSGLELCRRLAEVQPDLPVLVLTAFGSLDTAVGAIRAGAYDFITKPVDLEALALALERAVKHRALKEEVTRLRRVVRETRHFEDILGGSAAMQKVFELLDRVAESEATVLVSGESGTGKEMVARALHARSPRRQKAFVALNCAAMPEALLESELFGHARGAFTDAKEARVGLFVQAHGGTLFLDEIGDMPLGLQPKLLRALQERVVRPVGGESEVPFDVRIVVATNHDLESLVEEKRFRSDLFYRINVIHVELPPLRARGGDVLLLAQRFLDHFATRAGKAITALSPEAAEKLLAYTWPGNVRELQNCLERAVALSAGPTIGVEDLPDKVRRYRAQHVVISSDDPSELASMEEVERRYIARVMEAVGGNKVQAARILGFDRKTLYRKLERYQLNGAPASD
jgi:two-component system response regulator HydG